MLTLRQVTEELQRVMQLVADAEGELDDELERRLDAVEGSWQDRLAACAYARERLRLEEAEAEHWGRVARERVARTRARLERLERYMATNMREAGIERAEVRSDKADLQGARKALQQWQDGELSDQGALQALEVTIGLPGELPPLVLELYESRHLVVDPSALPQLPAKYLRTKVEANLVALRKLLDAGVPLPDGVEVQREWKLKDKRS